LVIPGFPLDEFRKDTDAGFKIEAERGLILKADFDGVVVGRDGEFRFGNDLALCPREPKNALIGKFLSWSGSG
jgi:hypothetical protein